MAPPRIPIVVLLSGSGSNLQAIIDAAQRDLPVEIRAVVSNRADAYGLERARQAGIAARILSHQEYADRAAYDVISVTSRTTLHSVDAKSRPASSATRGLTIGATEPQPTGVNANHNQEEFPAVVRKTTKGWSVMNSTAFKWGGC